MHTDHDILRRFSALRLLVSVALLAGVAAGAAFLGRAVHAGSEAEHTTEARAAYQTKISEHYNYRFGNDKPFLPSNATTDTGQFIDPKDFPTAAYCGHCHKEAHAEWRESVHSNANRVPYYLRNVDLLTKQKGVAFTRHCEGCHDPIALLSGSLTDGNTKRRPYDQDGVTCMVCHSIKSTDTRGTGSYVMGLPAVLLDEQGEPIHRAVSDGEILAHLDRHSAAVMKPFYKSSEFCAACHKAALPRALNDYKWLRAISLYDEWQNSSFAKESPLPFYKKPEVSTCNTCHMPRVALGTLPDYGAKNHTLASHRWAAANTLIPQIYHYDQQGVEATKFLKNNVLNIDLFALGSGDNDDSIAAPLGPKPFHIEAGQRVTLSVVIQNKGAAHSLVPEQRDMYEMFVDLRVVDAAGAVVAESGALQPNRELDPEAHSFTNRLINDAGGMNDLHQVWNNRVVAYNNTIQSGRSQLVRYAFTMPRTAGPVTVTASVRYRRFDQHFINFGMDMAEGKNYDQPLTELASSSRVFRVGDNPAVKPEASENPEWMRWNNYGIALLDAQQYAASAAAFKRVTALRPDYADAYTNVGIAYMQWERFDEAVPLFEKALSLAQGDARALYYLALVQRNQGHMEESIANLQKVAKAFPRSRDAHRELGSNFYQLHRYNEARAEYETVQTIDPDDLSAHYNLAILYRRMGMKDKAAVESAYFADQKDDPTAAAYALEFLRKHGEIAQESVPWHVHDADHKGTEATDEKKAASASATQGSGGR